MFKRFVAILTLSAMLVPDVHAQSTAFTYQGELLENGGLANGQYNMDFTLWNAVAGGNQIGGTLMRDGVQVAAGRFAVELDWGASAFDNAGRWLEIEVNGVRLSPRTEISRSPYSIQTRGIFVDDEGEIGIGTTDPQDDIHVVGNQPTLRLDHSASTDSYTELIDATDSQLRINKNNGSGSVFLDLNPKASDGASSSLVRFFRETDTTGTKGLRLYRGNNSTQLSAIIGVDGANSVFQAHGGNFGIGIGPEHPLDVAGTANFRGRVGIGDPSSFFGQLTVVDSGDGAPFAIDAEWNSNSFPAIYAGNSGSGGSLWAVGQSDVTVNGGGLIVAGDPAGASIAIDDNEIMARDSGSPSTLHLNADGGRINMGQHDIQPAFAYGRIAPNGVIANGSSNIVESTRISRGYYYIRIGGDVDHNDITLATAQEGFVASMHSRDDGFNNYYEIHTTGLASEEPADCYVSFLIFRP